MKSTFNLAKFKEKSQVRMVKFTADFWMVAIVMVISHVPQKWDFDFTSVRIGCYKKTVFFVPNSLIVTNHCSICSLIDGFAHLQTQLMWSLQFSGEENVNLFKKHRHFSLINQFSTKWIRKTHHFLARLKKRPSFRYFLFLQISCWNVNSSRV